jgi:signal transduction histidine kinase
MGPKVKKKLYPKWQDIVPFTLVAGNWLYGSYILVDLFEKTDGGAWLSWGHFGEGFLYLQLSVLILAMAVYRLAHRMNKTRKFYTSLFMDNPVAMVLCDVATGKILATNKLADTSLVLRNKEGSYTSLDLALDDGTDFKALVANAIKKDTGTLELGIWQHIDLQGNCRHSLVFKNIFMLDKQKTSLFILLDVTSQKAAETLIHKQNEAFKRISAYQSHQVRGPVVRILGLVGLFQPSDPTSEFNQEILSYLKVTAKELDQAVHDIVIEATK